MENCLFFFNSVLLFEKATLYRICTSATTKTTTKNYLEDGGEVYLVHLGPVEVSHPHLVELDQGVRHL